MDSKDLPAAFKDATKNEVTVQTRLLALEEDVAALQESNLTLNEAVLDGTEEFDPLVDRVETLETSPRLKRVTPVACTSYAALTAFTANTIDFIAKALGVAGNAISVEIVILETEKAYGITVNDNVISIYLATNSGLAVTTTLNDIIASIMDDQNASYSADAAALVTAVLTGTGTTIASALAETHLSGGVNNGTEAADGSILFDDDYLYVCVEECDGSEADLSHWKQTALSAIVEES